MKCYAFRIIVINEEPTTDDPDGPCETHKSDNMSKYMYNTIDDAEDAAYAELDSIDSMCTGLFDRAEDAREGHNEKDPVASFYEFTRAGAVEMYVYELKLFDPRYRS